MRLRNRALGLPKLALVGVALGVLLLVPLGRVPVEAWTGGERGDAVEESGGSPDHRGGQQTEPAGAPSPDAEAAGPSGDELPPGRANLVTFLVGTLAVLLLVRWRLLVRGRQHYPRS